MEDTRRFDRTINENRSLKASLVSPEGRTRGATIQGELEIILRVMATKMIAATTVERRGTTHETAGIKRRNAKVI